MRTAFLGINCLIWLDTNPYLDDLSCFSSTQGPGTLTRGPIIYSARLEVILKRFNIKPKLVWENLHLEGVKPELRRRVRTLSGVYAIVNLVNGSIYVGSAVTGNLGNRFHKHLFGLSGSVPVRAAVSKYGLPNFAFILLDTLEGEITQETNSDLLKLEDHYISLLQPIYNIALKSGNTFGVKHTESTKAHLRANYSIERRETIGALNRGKTFSPITLARLTAAALAREPFTEATRAAISVNSAKAQLYEVSLVDASTKVTILRTLPAVSAFIGCSEKTVRRALKTNGIVKGKWLVVCLGKRNSK